MTRILVLGKNGQLGQELVNVLNEQGREFVAYSHQQVDVTDYKNLEKKINEFKPKIIINTTAYHVTFLCEVHPLKAFNTNCIAVHNLAKISKEIGAKFVTYSTNYVFDGNKKAPYDEKDVPSPLQMYGLSKLAGEISSLSEYPSGTFVIRTCSVFGGGKRGSKSKKGNFILKVLNEAKNSSEIYASKKQIVNPTFARELASSTIKLLNLNPEPGIYHLASEGTISWYEFVEKILRFSKSKKVKIKEFENNEENKYFKSPFFSAISNRKAKKLGIVLPSIEDSLKEYLEELSV